MKCPVCGQAELVPDTRDVPYTYKGHTTAIKAITGEYCDACGDAVYGPDAGRKLSAGMVEFKRKIDAG